MRSVTFSLPVCLLLSGLSRAVQVYLHPAPALSTSQLSVDGASLVLSHQLGLDAFEPLGANEDLFVDQLVAQPFVGQGQKSALLITLDEADATAALPAGLRPTFSIDTPPVSSLSSLISTYLHRAAQTFPHISSIASHKSAAPGSLTSISDVFSTPSAAASEILDQLDALLSFLDDATAFDKPTEDGATFAAFELSALRAVADTYGSTSEEYATSASSIGALLAQAFSEPSLRVALLVFPSTPAKAKRAAPQQSPLPPQLPQTPIGSSARCFTDAATCGNATSACSGRGECVRASRLRAGQACFVCACAVTEEKKGAKTHWAGEACERKDISGPFVLITGTVIALILLIGGSVSLLYSVGGDELPGVLTGGIAGGSKRD